MPTWTEKEIEDWACEEPDEIWHGDSVYVRLVGRQLTLPSGRRLDVMLLALDRDEMWRLVVVEIKAGTTDTAALVQLGEYVQEVRRMYAVGVRVSGVLLAPNHNEQVSDLIRFMPGFELAWAQMVFQFDGVTDYSGWGPSRPALDCCYTEHTADAFEPIRGLVSEAANSIRKAKRKNLPVRLCDTPRRVYQTMPGALAAT